MSSNTKKKPAPPKKSDIPTIHPSAVVRIYSGNTGALLLDTKLPRQDAKSLKDNIIKATEPHFRFSNTAEANPGRHIYIPVEVLKTAIVEVIDDPTLQPKPNAAENKG